MRMAQSSAGEFKKFKKISAHFGTLTRHTIYCQLSFSYTSIDGQVVFFPAVFQSFYCDYTLYETDTFLRRTKDVFETVNRQLGSAL